MPERRAGQGRWTTWQDVVAKLRRRWDSGVYARAHAAAAPWVPFDVVLRSPSARELSAEFEAVRTWEAAWSRIPAAQARIERAPVGGRLVGANELPARVWFDVPEQLWRALGVADEVARLDEVLSASSGSVLDWARNNPLRAIALAPHWPRILAAVGWLAANAGSGRYLREIDVAGVDTKVVEEHRAVLGELLDATLDPVLVRMDVARTSTAQRYGFACRPAYVRLRTLDPAAPVAGAFLEATLRVDELGAAQVFIGRVIVVENETTYLALPSAAGTWAIFGGGYAASVLSGLPWLADVELHYWGDLDTHGFTILDRVRAAHPHTRSMLMDRRTLLEHEDLWGHEPTPTRAHLPHLTDVESALYRDLVENTFGPSVRLEQERISFATVRATL